MHLIDQLRLPYQLKYVQRVTKRGERTESTAEHVYSLLMLSEYFLKQHPLLDPLLVHRYLLYHDLVEIYAGDTNFVDEKRKKTQAAREAHAATRLQKELAPSIARDFEKYWSEYLAKSTPEARFSKAMDVLDPIIQIMAYPEEWEKIKYTEKKLRESKEPYLKEFPLLWEFFNELVHELNKRKIIAKETH